MLNHTFCHIHGIGAKTESRLWQSGIRSWNDWREPTGVGLSKKSRLEIPEIFEASHKALAENDPGFFASRLASGDLWRIYPHFCETTAYLDIETTGLGEGAEITTISLFNGKKVSYYVNGRNLNDFEEDICKYNVLVSYNGKGFDVPFIERFFKMQLKQAHIDLRFVLARLGIKGGLKGCEKQLGINRGVLDGVDGSFAVYLWRQYERYNDEKALETLLAYNIEDTVNLERLLVEACNRNIAATPFANELTMPCPAQPDLVFSPDQGIIEKIRYQFQ